MSRITPDTLPFAAVIFDLDGLLVDSEPLQAWAWDAYAQQHGKRLRPEILHAMLGRRAIDTMDIYLGSLGIDVPPEVAIAERDKIFIAAVPDGIQLKPGAADLLDWLEARQVPTALATSGQRHYVDLVLRDVTHPFGARMTAEHVTRGKPAPDIYLAAAAALGIDPARCLALEDAVLGVQAAVAAGMTCWAVPDDPAHGFDLSHAHRILPSLTAVLDALQQSQQTN